MKQNQLIEKTKEELTFQSGSSVTNFLFLRIIVLNEILKKYNFAILMDGFRDSEISTQIEEKYLEILKKSECQAILTATIKEDENTPPTNVNAISYDLENDSVRLLSEKSNYKVNEIKERFKYEFAFNRNKKNNL